MKSSMLTYICAAGALMLAACQNKPVAAEVVHAQSPPPASSQVQTGEIRATGKVRAVQEFTVLVPAITGQGNRLTLVSLVPNGSLVKEGDVIAEFDPTQQLDQMRDTQAKYDDAAQQVTQRIADNRTNAEKRSADLMDAQAVQRKADIDMRKGPALPEIDQVKAQINLTDSNQHLESLHKSQKAHETADAAALRVLELKRDRLKVSLDRGQRNLERMVVKAPVTGMVALATNYRSGNMAVPQEGDLMYFGQPLLRIFDPKQMEVETYVGEPDGSVLVPGVHAEVVLDAYPELTFQATLTSSSPVAAASSLGSPIKMFMANFRVAGSDPHLLPDLAAAVIIKRKAGQP